MKREELKEKIEDIITSYQCPYMAASIVNDLIDEYTKPKTENKD